MATLFAHSAASVTDKLVCVCSRRAYQWFLFKVLNQDYPVVTLCWWTDYSTFAPKVGIHKILLLHMTSSYTLLLSVVYLIITETLKVCCTSYLIPTKCRSWRHRRKHYLHPHTLTAPECSSVAPEAKHPFQDCTVVTQTSESYIFLKPKLHQITNICDPIFGFITADYY